MPTMYLIRGLPGSGKSWLAEAIAAFTDNVEICEADDYHYNKYNVYEWKPENVHTSHLWCQAKCRLAMQEMMNVVVSNTSVKQKEVNVYLDMARDFGYNVMVINCQSTFNSVHDVPQEVIESMRRKFVHKEFEL